MNKESKNKVISILTGKVVILDGSDNESFIELQSIALISGFHWYSSIMRGVYPIDGLPDSLTGSRTKGLEFHPEGFIFRTDHISSRDVISAQDLMAEINAALGIVPTVTMADRIKKIMPMVVSIDQEKCSEILKVEAETVSRLVCGDLTHIGDALLDGKDIEMLSDGRWIEFDFLTMTPLDYDIRVKPEKKMVEVNGKMVPAPETCKPAFGDRYYTLAVSYGDASIVRIRWGNGRFDNKLLASGFVFLTAYDAKDYFEAMMGVEIYSKY